MRAAAEEQRLQSGAGSVDSCSLQWQGCLVLYRATLSDPALCFLPAGIPIDGKTVFTSDHALKLDWIPQWIAIIGSGYIGLEFSDVYTALGSDVTFIEACLRLSSTKYLFGAQCRL